VFAVCSLVAGIGSGISEGWHYPENPFNRFDDPKYQQPQAQKGATSLSDQFLQDTKPGRGPYTLLDDDKPAQTKPWEDFAALARTLVKEFSIGHVQFGYMLAGLVIGAILLGLAYVFAWVLVGFAPGN
jgi:hypothetical protein